MNLFHLFERLRASQSLERPEGGSMLDQLEVLLEERVKVVQVIVARANYLN